MKRLLLSVVLLLAAARVRADGLFPHTETSPFWIAGQLNGVYQLHGSFESPYSGPNSFRSEPQNATSLVVTLYSGYAFTAHQELLVDGEITGGRGLSDALGLAGFTDLDVVRNPDLGGTPYIARLMYHAVIPLSTHEEPQERTFASILTRLPARRVEVRIGKVGIVDFFDVNNPGGDSHTQFLNWTVDNNGAYDYVADTRGYTIAAIVEYDDPRWSVRGAVGLMPTVANGIKYDTAIGHARGQQIEIERRWTTTTARVLVYDNLARMGNYRQSLALSHPPDITATRQPGRTKFGIGVNAEHSIRDAGHVFGRIGWNDGRNETFAYTEVDRTLEIGGDITAIPHRHHDKAGVAFVTNGISGAHRDYLAAGGLGFLLGDGALRYGHERIAEAYYTAFIAHGLYLSGDVQYIANPGYNRDRGPVWVPGVRLHFDF